MNFDYLNRYTTWLIIAGCQILRLEAIADNAVFPQDQWFRRFIINSGAYLMLTNNPFSELALSISPGVMQTFVIVMVLLVVAGTIFDVIHKKSAKYFFENMQRSKKNAKPVAGGEKVGIAIKTVTEDVLASGEFCNPKRRIAHLLTMYGFILFVVSTAVMIFSYTSADAGSAGIWAVLWHIGALAVCVGGYWFWFFIRVDVAAEGNSPFRLMKADLVCLVFTRHQYLCSALVFLPRSGALGWLLFCAICSVYR